MLKCQFCGTAVEYIEPTVAECEPEPLPLQDAAPDRPLTGISPTTIKPSAREKDRSQAKRKKGPANFVIQIAIGLVILAFFYFMVSHLLMFFPGLSRTGGASESAPVQESSASPPPDSAATDLGIDIYPGVRTLSAPDRAISPDRSSVSAVFVSDDSMDKVIAFYKARMTGQTTIYASGDGVVVSISPNPQESTVVTIGPATSGGKTKISIAHTTTSGRD